MWSVVLFISSALIAIVLGIWFPDIAGKVQEEFKAQTDSVGWKVAVGAIVWIVLQFFVINPARMWRNAMWIRNVEGLCVEIGSLRKEGTTLRHRQPRHPLKTHKDKERWVRTWECKFQDWHQRALRVVENLNPSEVSGFDPLGDISPPRTEVGVTLHHVQRKATLAEKVKKLDEIRIRNQPREGI